MAAEGFDIDVTYVDASGSEHTFLLDVDCRTMKWKLFDARLGDLTLTGKHGPPGIDTPIGAITGTAFWNEQQGTLYFVLLDFLSIPFFKSKYSKGQEGVGRIISLLPGYHLSSNDLKWVIG